MPVLFLSLLAATGCAPPVLDEAPGIDILFPYSSQVDTFCPTMVVVVDVTGFSLSAEGIDQDEVEGEGHWHLLVDGEYIGLSATDYFLVDDSLALEPGRVHALSAALRTNQHNPLDPDVVSGEVEINVDDVDDCIGGVGPDAAPGG